MSLDKAILHGKEKRKKFYGSKAVDNSCRNNGSCSWCKGNRLYNSTRKIEEAIAKELEFNNIGREVNNTNG